MHRLKLVKNAAKKKKSAVIISIALILTVQVICLCCISVASAGAHSSEGSAAQTDAAAVKDDYSQLFYEKAYASSYNLALWLKDLMDATGERLNYTGTDMICEEAVKRGILAILSV